MLKLDVVTSQPFKLWVMAIGVSPRLKSLFTVMVPKSLEDRLTDRGWCPAGPSSHIPSNLWLELGGRLDGCTPFFPHVNRDFKKRVFLDEAFNDNGSRDLLMVRPWKVWVDMKRQLKFFTTVDCDGLFQLRFDEDPVCYHVVFVIIMYRRLESEGEMDVDVKVGQPSNSGCSDPRRSGNSASSTMRLSQMHPSLKMRNISSFIREEMNNLIIFVIVIYFF
ncbi:hypothetical protein EAF04_003506 [Stromatinia cepivora]|nr:hypothetical protein EAF04_003506 [Stromatinia cepivora]